MHLDERTYRQLLDGSLDPAEARKLARHLEGDCEACEGFLEERGGADELDGRVDRVLAALAPPGTGEGNDLELAGIDRALRSRPVHRRRAAILALAATVAVAGLAGILIARTRAPPVPWDGFKGTAPRAIPVRLRFVVVGGDPARPTLEKGVSGEAVAAASSLQFEVELGRPAEVALVRVAPAGGPEVLFRERLQAGRTSVTIAGRPAAYPLGELSGPQRFAVVVAGEGLSPERITRAAEALAPPGQMRADLPGLDGLSLDAVDVMVR